MILPVQSINRSFIKTLDYAKCCGFDSIELYSVCSTEEEAEALKAQIDELGIDHVFRYDVTTLRNHNDILLNHIREESESFKNGRIFVIMGELVVTSPLAKVLHNTTIHRLQKKMQMNRNISILTVPYVV